MESVSQNGILKQEEFSRFKERTVGLRFKQQIAYGVGAAMVFGLITAIATKLVPMALGTAAPTITVTGATAATTVGVGTAAAAISIPAMLALGGIAVLGIGLIYLSAKFLSENTLLEQDFQAKKIGAAARGGVRLPEQVVDQKPMQFPSANAASLDKPAADQPQTSINERALEGRMMDANLAKVRA